MKLNGWRPGQQPRPRIQTIAQRTPAVAPQTKIMAVASTIFPPAQPAKRDQNQAIDPKYRQKSQDFDSCIAVADPCVAFNFKGFPPPTQEKLRVIASEPAPPKRVLIEAFGRAGEDARRRSHLLPSVLVSRVFCEMLLFSDLIKI